MHFLCGQPLPVVHSSVKAFQVSLATRPAVEWLSHGQQGAKQKLRAHVALHGGPTSLANNEIYS